jgi:hypothetical protein
MSADAETTFSPREYLALSSAPRFSTPFYPAMREPATGTATIVWWGRVFYSIASAFTQVFSVTPSSAHISPYAYIGLERDGTNNAIAVIISSSADPSYFAKVGLGSSDVPDGALTVMGASRTSAGCDRWVNGVQTGSNGATGFSAPLSDGQINVGRNRDVANPNGGVATRAAYLWNRVLSAEEHRLLARDPLAPIRSRSSLVGLPNTLAARVAAADSLSLRATGPARALFTLG